MIFEDQSLQMTSNKTILLVSILLIAGIISGCSAIRDLAREVSNQEEEVNLSFRIANNLLWLENTTIDGRRGRFAIATTLRISILDDDFAGNPGSRVRVSTRGVFGKDIEPERLPLGDEFDGLIGYDVIGPVVTIDYHNQIASVRNNHDFSDADHIYDFVGQPSLVVTIGTRDFIALVDTANPDTLHVPAAWIDLDPSLVGDRQTANVSIGGINLPDTDFLLIENGPARIGNRMLSRFIVSIDYSHHEIALWDRYLVETAAGTSRSGSSVGSKMTPAEGPVGQVSQPVVQQVLQPAPLPEAVATKYGTSAQVLAMTIAK